MMRTLAWTVVAVLLAPLASAASKNAIVDLGQPSGGTETRSIAPVSNLSIVIVNRVEKQAYSISVVRESIPIPELPVPGKIFGAGSADCAALTDAKKLKDLTDEAAVRNMVNKIASEHAKCTDDDLKDVAALVEATRYTVPDTFEVLPGERLTITVARADDPKKTWTVVLTTASRGSWRAHYGLGFVPNRDDRYFLAAADQAGQYTITKKREDPDGHRDLHPIPAVFFEWLSHSRELHNWSLSPTLGLGMKDDTPGFFAGLSLTYNQNLSVIAGFPIYRQLRLNGQYKEGQTVKENLTDEQLYAKQYRPHYWFFGGAFRFSSNPFGSSTSAEGKKNEEPEGKKAEKPGGQAKK